MVGLVMVCSLVAVVYCEGTGAGDRGAAVGALEASLLKLLGMERVRPREAPRPHIPEAMLQLYKQQTGMDIDTAALNLPGRLTRSANTARSFKHAESAIDARFKRNDKFRLSFNLTGLPKEERVTGAELRITVVDQGRRRPGDRLLVHDIVRPGVKGGRAPLLRLLDSKVVAKGERWMSLDVMPAAERWEQEPNHNHGLLVQIVGDNRTPTDPTPVRLRRSTQGDDETEPVLLLYTDDGKNKEHSLEEMLSRTKRQTSKKNKKKENCQRHALYVDFTDVGWNNWIVAPPGYDAYYCQGDCSFPLADHLNATNHAIVQTIVNSINPGAVPKACCVPTQLSPISMLYLDEEDKVVLKNYQEMAVLGCGCR